MEMARMNPDQSAKAENGGLRPSVFGALFMAALGFGFAALTDSRAVLLDGVFSLIGAVVSVVAMRVAALVRQPDDEHFHFGYAAYEPMLNLTKGLLIAFVSFLAAWASLEKIDLLRERTAQAIWGLPQMVGFDIMFTRNPRWLQQTAGTGGVD